MKPTLRTQWLVPVLLVFCIGSTLAGEWTELFNGRDLTGWKQINGTARYEVHEGAIRGWTAEGSPNSFLCTARDYGDFELEFEVQLDPRLNSGVQFRSLSTPDYRDGRVHGYQVEIAANGNAGLIYDEGRRGRWLNPDDQVEKKAAEGVFKADDWNRFRVVCRGNSIQTWINDVKISDLIDDRTASGFIGLQVHSFRGDTPAWVQWRNLRIREL